MNQLPRPVAPLLILAIVLAACTSGASSRPGSSFELIDPNPESPVANEPAPGGGGNAGSGNAGGGNAGPGGELTVPQPGQLDVHPVPADSLEAAVDGRAVTVKISWTSGVEPCAVLDTIVVERGEMAFAMTIQEGHAAGDNICIDIAKFKFALVDLGELEPGTYAISDATGGAAPIQVVVS